jgi:5-methyltetrahydrofolate--homocysteine methyltransferase
VDAVNRPAYDADLLDTLSRRVMVGDGAMGNNLEGCNEILNDTHPDILEQIHRDYFEAGADAVETKCVRLQSG